MKRILFSLTVLALTTTVFAQKKVADVAKFTSETIDFGKIKQGVPQKGTFTVTNISNEPMIIEQANPTCGCTIADYTKGPIAPGKTGVVLATYNAAAMGHFDKHLTVKFAGIDEIKSISFTGDVVAVEEFDKMKGETATKVTAPETKLKDTVAVAPAAPVKIAKKVKKTKKIVTADKTK